jgi:Mrr N-terminal domain
MAVPDSPELYLPVLATLEASDRPLTGAEVRDRLAKAFGLSEADLGQLASHSPTPVFTNHVAHALKVQQPELIQGLGRAGDRRYRLTDAGRNELLRLSRAGLANGRATRMSGDRARGGQPKPVAMEAPYVPGELPRRGGDAERAPTPGQRQPEHPDGVETLACREKATIEHERLLQRLQRLQAWLTRAGWTGVVEGRAVDLWGSSPDGMRVIFEAKAISDNSLSQCRTGLAQLL